MQGRTRLLLGVLLFSAVARGATSQASGGYAGRPLVDVLGDLRARGLKLIYSSDLVTEKMKVDREPRATAPRSILDEVLAPHGLAAHAGPAGTLLVVRATRERPSRASPPATDSGIVRFEETLDVTASPRSDFVGGAPLRIDPETVVATAGAGENVFRTLQALPGVAAPGDFDSRIAVRGGGPDENLTIIDGVEVHDPYRLLGFTSAFNPALVQNVELFSGGFDVRHGDRLASLLLVENRDGAGTRSFAGEASVNLSDASLAMEGRLPGTATGSWIVAGRRAYYDLVAEPVIDVGDLPSFSDLQAKLTWAPGAGNRLSLFGLLSGERTDIDTQNDSEDFVLRTQARNVLAGITFDSTLGNRARSRTVASFYRFENGIDFQGRIASDARRAAGAALDSRMADVVFVRDVDGRDFAFRQELSLAGPDRHTWDLGFEAHRLPTSWDWTVGGDASGVTAPRSTLPFDSGLPPPSLPRALDSSRGSWRTGLWVQDRFALGSHLSLRAGTRVDRSSINGETTWSPRFGTTITLGPATRIQAAAGVYHQSPGYEKLLQADYFLDLTPERLSLSSERSLHALVGIERDLSRSITARVEAYHKSFSRLLVGRLETEDERLARLARYDFPAALQDEIPLDAEITSDAVNDGRGDAWGVQVYLARRSVSTGTRLTGWTSYAFGAANREAYGQVYPFDYDRRHAFSLAGEYHLSSAVSIGVTGRVASGFPLTPALGVRVAPEEDRNDEDGDGNWNELIPARDSSGALVYMPDFGGASNLNSGRLPLFARLDARVTFRPGGSRGRWLFYVDLINVLNRENAGRISTIVQRRFTNDSFLAWGPTATPDGLRAARPTLVESRILSIPFLPTFGVHCRF